MDISLDIGGFIVYTVYAVRKGVRQMKRYTVDFITEGRQKLFYITPYIFVDDKDTAHAMPYTKVQYRVTAMIYDKDLRDDNGELFGCSTHIYRHYYGVKLTEMHLDDWTIAKLLGHSSVRNVKYYRKMSNQLLADETRKALQKLSAIILNNLDGWEDEYEQIRKDGRL